VVFFSCLSCQTIAPIVQNVEDVDMPAYWLLLREWQSYTDTIR